MLLCCFFFDLLPSIERKSKGKRKRFDYLAQRTKENSPRIVSNSKCKFFIHNRSKFFFSISIIENKYFFYTWAWGRSVSMCNADTFFCRIRNKINFLRQNKRMEQELISVEEAKRWCKCIWHYENLLSTIFDVYITSNRY